MLYCGRRWAVICYRSVTEAGRDRLVAAGCLARFSPDALSASITTDFRYLRDSFVDIILLAVVLFMCLSTLSLLARRPTPTICVRPSVCLSVGLCLSDCLTARRKRTHSLSPSITLSMCLHVATYSRPHGSVRARTFTPLCRTVTSLPHKQYLGPDLSRER